ncbi:glycine dehydrogenase [Prochlorococcus phage MED4-213]|uniref:glycine dehydrogenase (aminomethyl-transferring) n=1 Tax=Prochlorococcus phage MED4-213 TaxID=889956 RepID=M4QFZ1_9CAUD|nr:glycine dehydrogenase [Prochlorococcus phage MED4-213]AGH26266.1 glycine dehydrogenase [Prochlorococcus phage MED4-213]
MSDFLRRHIGPSKDQQTQMLQDLGLSNLDELVRQVVPDSILLRGENNLPKGCHEHQALAELKNIAKANKVKPSLIGQGYYGTITPPVIQRNVLENPSWYTSYTPYQAEISQGRLEALFNYQTLITELTGLPIANASLLDEATAAAEAMLLAYNSTRDKKTVIVDQDIFPQTLAVLETRAKPLGIEIKMLDIFDTVPLIEFDDAFAMIVQLPNKNGQLKYCDALLRVAEVYKCVKIAIVDPMCQVLMQPVGEWGFDIAVGSMQRFGIPMGYGGPHAAFFATTDKYKRKIPGRIVGQSVDSEGNPAYRLALQTREQHIRRDKATSNICTAQALLANMSGFYAAYHGADGLHAIARRIRLLRQTLVSVLKWNGFEVDDNEGFDTVRWKSDAPVEGYNVKYESGYITLSLDELSNFDTVFDIVNTQKDYTQHRDTIYQAWDYIVGYKWYSIPERTKPWLTQEVFNKYHSETDMMRYIYELCSKDFSLVNGMVPLGSCTMKLNAAAELMPVSWEEFANVHPHTPMIQTMGYQKIIDDLQKWLCDITGFDSISLQPNAGSQGEYAGLLAIQAYHQGSGDDKRNVCLIPESAHGTNPASAVMAGMKVVGVKCDDDGNIDIKDLEKKAIMNTFELSCIMITYPSTHGVFETNIRQICKIVHDNGGQVYLDGANLNAQVGLAKPCDYGADVCHLNLHKTFCIPHGGGGPGVGPIGVAKHLTPFVNQRVSAAVQGSASILPISWMYIRMMGADGLKQATEVALLSANWLAHKIEDSFKVLYKGENGRIAHECIFDCRNLPVTAEDIAKRLMDYGFHAPTLSWPVLGTMMVEPTESESLDELQRFVDAMDKIKREIHTIPEIVKNAPHTQSEVCGEWVHAYTREEAVFPNSPKHKFWPAVARIDNVYGDRNLVCSCSVIIDGDLN